MADEKDAMVEVRFMCPRAFVDVADAYGIANGKTRTDIGVLRYLDLRGLLERHPTQPWVRVRDEDAPAIDALRAA